MAINIVIRLLIAWFGIGALYFAMMPVIHEFAYNLTLWNSMPQNLLVIRDNLYSVFLITGIIAFSVTVLWAYSAATNKVVTDNEYIG